jgi:hypothetical protein
MIPFNNDEEWYQINCDDDDTTLVSVLHYWRHENDQW